MRILAKEFHQQKWMLISGCAAGLAFPIVEYSLAQRPGVPAVTESGISIVLAAGAFFGILLAAATTWHDARKGACDFIMAKPFSCSRIFVTKVILAAIFLPLVMLLVSCIDLVTNYGNNEGLYHTGCSILLLTWPVALMLFALTMFLVVVTQDPAKSVIMAVWAAMLVYLLPVMLNGLEWLSFFWHLDNANNSRDSFFTVLLGTYLEFMRKDQPSPDYNWKQALPYMTFMGTIVAATAAFTWLSIKAMKRRWHWQPGQKTIVWIMGIVTAVIFGQAMLQVGQNLQPLKEFSGRPVASSVFLDYTGTFWEEKRYFSSYEDAFCCTDDLMFLVGKEGRQITDDSPRQDEFVLYAYRFPWPANALPVPDSNGRRTTFLAARLTLFALPPIEANWAGPAAVGCVARDDMLYAFYEVNDCNDTEGGPAGSIHQAVIDVSNPSSPVLCSEVVIGNTGSVNCAGFAVGGDYCYINAGDRLIVVSLQTPGKPLLAAEMSYSSIVEGLQNAPLREDRRVYSPLFMWDTKLVVSGHLLIAHNRRYIAVFDITEPARPRTLFCQDIQEKLRFRSTDRGWRMAWDGDYCYVSTIDGLFVFKFLKGHGDTYSLNYVGRRLATPLERFAYRYPLQLVIHNGHLVEAACNFGVLVYDISDPLRPRRIYHASASRRVDSIGIWQGLLYTIDWHQLNLYDIPPAPSQ